MPEASESFKAFECAGWERVAEKYETTWAGLTRQYIPALLDGAQVGRGTRVLDVACGPGYVAEMALQRGATVTGLDFSPRMVELARSRAPTLDFQTGDAEALPFPDQSFDAVTTNFGVLHFSRPEVALAEAARVLRPGGRYAFTVWAGPEESAGAKLVESAIQAHANLDVPLPKGPERYGFGTASEARAILTRAGFAPQSIALQPVTVEWRIPTSDFLFEAERDAGVRTTGLLAAQEPATLEAIRRTFAAGMRPFKVSDGYAVPFVAHLILAAA